MPWTGAGLGTVSGRIAFTNRAARPCRLRGWPVLRLVTAQGAVTVANDRLFVMSGPTLPTAPLVILRHGTTAEAVFTGGDNPLSATEGMCPSYRFLRISPPGDSRAATLPAWIWYYGHDMPVCTRIFISPVVPWADLYQGRQDNDPAGRPFSRQPSALPAVQAACRRECRSWRFCVDCRQDQKVGGRVPPSAPGQRPRPGQ